ncbi:MAG: hypothetical protein ACLFVW_03530 [Phycisphaerae bacterium]
MKSLLKAVLISLSVLAASVGGCVDLKVDRDAVRVGRFLEPSERQEARSDTQLPASDHGDEAI